MGVLDKVKVKKREEGDVAVTTVRHNIGVKTKMGYLEFVYTVLEENEKRDDPFNDTTIAEIIKAEFPKHIKKLTNKRKETKSKETLVTDVRRLRRDYNSGKPNSLHEKPAMVSIRYNDNGQPINNRGHWMKFSYFKKQCERLGIKDPRLRKTPKEFFCPEDE